MVGKEQERKLSLAALAGRFAIAIATVTSAGCTAGVPEEPDAEVDAGSHASAIPAPTVTVGTANSQANVVNNPQQIIHPPPVTNPFHEDPTIVPLPDLCDDHDGDGFGVNCRRGSDCNDLDRNSTNECYHCALPGTGCACNTEGAVEACNVATDDNQLTAEGLCHSGTRLCTGGQWQRCLPNAFSTRTLVNATSCGSACNPDCRLARVCPDNAADLNGRGMGVVLGNQPLPGFCPPGSGGIQLPGGGAMPPPACVTPCGGGCCGAGQTCYAYEDLNVWDPAICNRPGAAAPPPVRWSACGPTCAAGQTHCGNAPNDDCCTAAEECAYGQCVPRVGACVSDAQCPAGSFCDVGLGRCLPYEGGSCNCQRDPLQQSCINSIRTGTAGRVVNDIFHTRTGGDARTLRMARYMSGIETNPTGCPMGRSNFSNDPTFGCPWCTPTVCTSYNCFGAPRTQPNISAFASNLDWLWTQHLRLNPVGGVSPDQWAPPAGQFVAYGYDPTEGRKYDLGAPANRVVLFPITDHVNDSCLEPFEYTVWMSDNPNALTIAPANAPDPNQWNLAVLTEVYRRGWTRNPNSQGNPMDMTDLNTTAFGDAVADAMTTVWALPCGYSFRYASIVAGNLGNPTNACAFHSADDELDAVAGLTINGDSLSIYHELPFGSSAGPDGLNFSTNLRTADVYFLFDTTGSMGGELARLRADMTAGTFVAGCPGGIIGAIKCVIPDAAFGVGRMDDFPRSFYGSPGCADNVLQHFQSIDPNPALSQAAVNSLNLHCGSDWPESQTAALWGVATGRGLNGFYGDRVGCPAGTFGYPCFRGGAIPIVMLFTDAPFHNGLGGTNAYDESQLFAGGNPAGVLGTQRSPTFAEAVDAFNARGMKYIGIDSSGGNADALRDSNGFASATGSVVAGGALSVYRIGQDGSGLGAAVVNAVSDLANYSRMDVTAVALDNPATPAVDERCFVTSIPGAAIGTVRLSNPVLGEGAPYAAGRCVDPPTAIGGVPVMARQCLPGSQINFRATFTNNCVRATAVRQTFTFDILVQGNGSYELGRVPVTIVVPESAFPATGTFTYDIDSTTACGASRQARWSNLQWVASTPNGTSINIDLYTAPTLAGLAMATPIRLGTAPPAVSPLDIQGALITAMQPTTNSFLRVVFTLNSNAGRDTTPVLNGYRVLYDCIDGV